MERCSQSKSTKQMFGPAASTFKISFFYLLDHLVQEQSAAVCTFLNLFIYFFLKKAVIICLKKESNGERQRHPSCIHKLNFLHSSWTHGVCLFVYVYACVCVVRVSCSSWKQRCSLCWKVDSVAGLWRCCQLVCVEDGCGRQRAGISPCHLSDHRVPRPAVNDMSASAWLKKNSSSLTFPACGLIG